MSVNHLGPVLVVVRVEIVDILARRDVVSRTHIVVAA